MHIFRTQGRLSRMMALATAILLALSYILSASINTTKHVYAAEVQNRSITMGTTEADAETTYTVQFDLTSASNIGAFVVEFCNNSPLPNTTCTNTAVGDDVPQIDGNAGSTVTFNTGSSTIGSGNCDASSNVTLDTIANGDRSLLLQCTAVEAFSGGETITLVFDNVDNPDNSTSGNNNDSFYARIYTYSVTAAPDPNTNNPVDNTSQVDDGGIALSTAEQLTITARVQETLNFCVGTTDADTQDDCTDISGNNVDIGVIDSGAVSVSPVAANPNGGNNVNGLAMIRTNAANGVVVDYFAEQASTGTNHLGALRVSGASCNAGDVETDQCFLSSGTVQSAMTAGTEQFGMTISSIDTTNGTTTNLSRDAAYDGDGVQSAEGCTAADAGVDEDCWTWDDSGSTDRIASSSTVVDDEMLILRFAATSAITTPTGLYTVTSTYIATPTF